MVDGSLEEIAVSDRKYQEQSW